MSNPYDCTRTAAEVVATGVGVCICGHQARYHFADDGCRRCAETVDRVRLYRGTMAAYARRRTEGHLPQGRVPGAG